VLTSQLEEARAERGAKIDGGEMVFWFLQDQFQQDSRPLFFCFGRHTFAAKEAPKDMQFENRSLGIELHVFWCKWLSVMLTGTTQQHHTWSPILCDR
jgi:hypothetical protein